MAREPRDGKTWSVRVYLAGDNSLSDEMVWSLKEMAQAATGSAVRDRIDLSVLFDPSIGEPLLYDLSSVPEGVDGDGRARRSLGALGALGAKHSSFGGAQQVSKLVERFVTGAFERPPEKVHRGIILSGHGTGAAADFLEDRDPEGALSIPALGKILRRVEGLSGSSIDVLGLDTCQMSTVEVADEVRGSVSYLVASEGPVVTTGWPYREVLESLADSAEPRSAARTIAESYLEFYRDYEIAGVSTDISVTELSLLGKVGEAVRELAHLLSEPLAKLASHGLEEMLELDGAAPSVEVGNARSIRNALVLAHWSAQSYKCDRYVDLADFAEQLVRFLSPEQNPQAVRIRDGCRRLLGTIAAAVTFSGFTGGDFQHSHGLSIYFPWSSRDFFPDYRNLRFARETGWADFLGLYLAATERMRRFQSAHLRGSVPVESRRTESVSSTVEKESGTRDPETGTRRGASCRSTMKNPPQGYYPSGE